MFLHKLTPSLRHPQARKDLASRYELHRTLASALAIGEGVPPADRYLWRLDQGRDGAPAILVQTAQPVDWSPLERRHHGYCEDIKANKAMPAGRFEPGEVFHFRLHASPSRMSAGKRSALIDEEEQLAWIRRVAGENGFEIVACDRRHGCLEKHHKADGNHIILAVAEFDGVLRVADMAAFADAIECGIGRGKAFGFGMLSLAPATAG